MSAPAPYRIEYVSPGIVRDGNNNFCLVYTDSGGSADFYGLEPDGVCTGVLYFPGEDAWHRAAPALHTPRETVKAQLIAYAGANEYFDFLTDFLADEALINAANKARAARL